MLKRVCLGVMLVVLVAGLGWAVTLDDVMKEVVSLKVEIAGIKSDINWLRNITATFFVALFAAISGLFYFVFDISRSLRVPKEERVAKLESFMEKVKEQLRIIDEKLHLPKSVLILLLSVSLLSAASLAAIPEMINIQGVLI